MSARLAASILSADFSCLHEQLDQIAEGGASALHIDVMDGHFVPNLTIGPMILEAIRPHTQLACDVHLMVDRPEDYIERFAAAGADSITFHLETTYHIHRLIQHIQRLGIKAGVALNPATSVERLAYIIDTVDIILIMTVDPGFGGQSLIPATLKKVAVVHQMIKDCNPNVELAVDGGINSSTIRNVANAGADVLVVGSAAFRERNISSNLRTLRTMISP